MYHYFSTKLKYFSKNFISRIFKNAKIEKLIPEQNFNFVEK
ncbi:hypothetical protein [Spiroplasma endosymbiont of Amphimallon solstitiale]